MVEGVGCADVVVPSVCRSCCRRCCRCCRSRSVVGVSSSVCRRCVVGAVVAVVVAVVGVGAGVAGVVAVVGEYRESNDVHVHVHHKREGRHRKPTRCLPTNSTSRMATTGDTRQAANGIKALAGTATSTTTLGGRGPCHRPVRPQPGPRPCARPGRPPKRLAGDEAPHGSAQDLVEARYATERAGVFRTVFTHDA